MCAMAVAPVADEENAVDGMAQKMAVHEEECRAVLRSRLNDPSVSRVIAIVHSEGPSHYTLLVRSRIGVGQYELRYYDSLRQASANGISKAQTFADQAGWESPVGPPVNGRFQEDGWSCG